MIKSFDPLSGLTAATSFQVTSSTAQPRIDVQVTTGTIYFPGDTTVVTVQASLKGQPVSVSSIQIFLIQPNGSNTTLNATLFGTGEWKATFSVPLRGSLGTYQVIVKARQTGSLDGTSITSFEVKPTWLQAHTTAISGSLAALGAVGVLVVSWRQGIFRRKKNTPLNDD